MRMALDSHTVKTLIKATLFNNYISKSRVSLEVEKIFCPLGVALLQGRILIRSLLVRVYGPHLGRVDRDR